uniref:Uncharacterized protein n=1 Tax=Anguilla anguilla TaxID=7936 RepID=A0A0E9Q2Q4_ANGAN
MQPLTLNWYCVSCITQLPICSFIQSVFAGIAYIAALHGRTRVGTAF